MSDDWGSYRSDQGDDEKDDLDTGRDDPGGWSEDDPGVHKTHWEDDAPEANRESESGWPTSGSTWQRPESGDTSSGWERSDYGDYDRYGYLRKDDLFDPAKSETVVVIEARKSGQHLTSQPGAKPSRLPRKRHRKNSTKN